MVPACHTETLPIIAEVGFEPTALAYEASEDSGLLYSALWFLIKTLLRVKQIIRQST